jgi:hypothetical protein
VKCAGDGIAQADEAGVGEHVAGEIDTHLVGLLASPEGAQDPAERFTPLREAVGPRRRPVGYVFADEVALVLAMGGHKVDDRAAYRAQVETLEAGAAAFVNFVGVLSSNG